MGRCSLTVHQLSLAAALGLKGCREQPLRPCCRQCRFSQQAETTEPAATKNTMRGTRGVLRNKGRSKTSHTMNEFFGGRARVQSSSAEEETRSTTSSLASSRSSLYIAAERHPHVMADELLWEKAAEKKGRQMISRMNGGSNGERHRKEHYRVRSPLVVHHASPIIMPSAPMSPIMSPLIAAIPTASSTMIGSPMMMPCQPTFIYQGASSPVLMPSSPIMMASPSATNYCSSGYYSVGKRQMRAASECCGDNYFDYQLPSANDMRVLAASMNHSAYRD